MNVYKGLRSTDAEICLDLVKGKATFDYSLNRYGNPLNSNYCVISKTGSPNVLLEILKFSACYLLSVTTLFLSPIFSYILVDYQHAWQKFLKQICIGLYGIEVQTSIGRLESNQKIFTIRNNIWFDYELSGDYEQHIESINLQRHFTIINRYGFMHHQQRGWDVIFKFQKPPEIGNCVLRSIAA